MRPGRLQARSSVQCKATVQWGWGAGDRWRCGAWGQPQQAAQIAQRHGMRSADGRPAGGSAGRLTHARYCRTLAPAGCLPFGCLARHRRVLGWRAQVWLGRSRTILSYLAWPAAVWQQAGWSRSGLSGCSWLAAQRLADRGLLASMAAAGWLCGGWPTGGCWPVRRQLAGWLAAQL